MITGETEGMIKLVADKATDRIIGAMMMAGELARRLLNRLRRTAKK